MRLHDEVSGWAAGVPAGGLTEALAFLPGVAERLGWYVYALRDPRSGAIFYVGKGRGRPRLPARPPRAQAARRNGGAR